MAVGVAIAVVRVYRVLTSIFISININANSWPFPADGSAGRGGPKAIRFSKSFGIAQATQCCVMRRLTVRKGYGAGSPCRFFRKLCSGSAMGSDWALRLGSRLAGEVARPQTNFESSAGHSTPWRAKEAATSSINSSIGAPQSNCEGSWTGSGSSFGRESSSRSENPG